MADTPDLPLFWAGLNSILFAINIDNKDLNGQSKFAPTVSDLLKESTQNVTSLLKESTQGVSSLFREITASSAVSILIKPEQDTDPLPVVSKHVSAGERERVWEFEPTVGSTDGGLWLSRTHLVGQKRQGKAHALGFSVCTCVYFSSPHSLRKGQRALLRCEDDRAGSAFSSPTAK